MRRMIDLLCCFRKRDHTIRINQEFRLDLDWWHTFLSSWNGVSFLLFPGLEPSPDVEVMLDASGSLGFGAFSSGAWFFGGNPSGISFHSLQGTVSSGDGSTGLGSYLALSACFIPIGQRGSGARRKHQVL